LRLRHGVPSWRNCRKVASTLTFTYDVLDGLSLAPLLACRNR
jgi:hypothetical protein